MCYTGGGEEANFAIPNKCLRNHEQLKSISYHSIRRVTRSPFPDGHSGTWSTPLLSSFPAHSQILSHSCREISCEINLKTVCEQGHLTAAVTFKSELSLSRILSPTLELISSPRKDSIAMPIGCYVTSDRVHFLCICSGLTLTFLSVHLISSQLFQ